MSVEKWELGVVLKEIRMRRNMSLTDVSREAGSSRSAVIRIERGDRHPGLETLTGLAGALKIQFIVNGEGAFIEDA